MNKVKISKTIYAIVSREEDEKYITCKIKKGNTEKTLIQNKVFGFWQLWSGRNGINELGWPKSCHPEFLTEEEAELLPKSKKRASTSKSAEIKKALKQAFPKIKFSVTNHNGSYYVKWQDGIRRGATLEAVKAIADNWDSCRNISEDPYEPYYVGDSVHYEHEITDTNWKQFVIEKVTANYGNGNVYEPKSDSFTPPNGYRWGVAHHENESYHDWLHNGIKCNLDSDRSRIDKELYYEFDAPVQEKESKAVDLDSSQDQEIEQEEEKPLNWYEQKQQDRKDRYLARATKAQRDSNAYWESSRAETEHIPPGQPVLLNHHSEKAHRKALKRSWDKLGKSVKAQEKAQYYLEKAEGVGNGGISSDDPDAIIKLNKQLEEATARQEKMKIANKLIRKQDKTGLAAMGFSDREITSLFTPDFCGRIGYPSFELTNNNANIRRLKARIKELEQSAKLETEEFTYDGLTVVHNTEENRVQLLFDSIPPKEFRQLLKSRGFRWSRTNKAWQRQLNGNGIYAAKCTKDEFLEL